MFGYSADAVPGVPEGTLSDQTYINYEIAASVMYVMGQDYFYVCSSSTSLSRPDVFTPPLSAGTKRQAAGDSEPEYCVPCLLCERFNKKGTGDCKWCGYRLQRIYEVRESARGAILSVLAKKRRPPRARRKLYDEVWGVDALGNVTRTTVRLNIQTLSCRVQGDDENDDDGEVVDGEGEVEVRRTLLPSLFINPNTTVAVREIMYEWARWFNLAGFSGNADPSTVRQYLFIVSDLGAADLAAFDDPSTTPGKFEGQNFMSFIFILGIFHECMMWIGIVMDILFAIGGDKLAAFHTYESEGAQGYLRRCGDLHKANDFLRHVVKPALMTAFLREYLFHLDRENIDKPQANKKAFNFDDAINWGFEVLNDEASEDLNLKNRLCFLLYVLPAYELIKKGVRSGDMSAYQAGRRALLPFVFALGKVKYAPALVRDMLQYYHRVPPEIRKEMNTIFGLFDEGINGKVEESNALQKGFVISETQRGVQAGAILVNSADTLREVQHNFGEKNPSTQHPKDRRTPTDLSKDIQACTTYLVERRVFERAGGGSVKTPAKTFEGALIKPSLTVIELLKYGKTKSKEWVESYVAAPDHKFPPCTRGRSFIPRKSKKSGKVIAEGVEGGQTNDGDDEEFEGTPDEEVAINDFPTDPQDP